MGNLITIYLPILGKNGPEIWFQETKKEIPPTFIRAERMSTNGPIRRLDNYNINEKKFSDHNTRQNS